MITLKDLEITKLKEQNTLLERNVTLLESVVESKEKTIRVYKEFHDKIDKHLE